MAPGLAHSKRWMVAALRRSRSVRGELGFRVSRSISRLLQDRHRGSVLGPSRRRWRPVVPWAQGRDTADLDSPEAGGLASAGGGRGRKHCALLARVDWDVPLEAL